MKRRTRLWFGGAVGLAALTGTLAVTMSGASAHSTSISQGIDRMYISSVTEDPRSTHRTYKVCDKENDGHNVRGIVKYWDRDIRDYRYHWAEAPSDNSCQRWVDPQPYHQINITHAKLCEYVRSDYRVCTDWIQI
ncbi:MAG: hypothetical protein ACRDT6_16985 [Micromonosporaceae bacterium]